MKCIELNWLLQVHLPQHVLHSLKGKRMRGQQRKLDQSKPLYVKSYDDESWWLFLTGECKHREPDSVYEMVTVIEIAFVRDGQQISVRSSLSWCVIERTSQSLVWKNKQKAGMWIRYLPQGNDLQSAWFFL